MCIFVFCDGATFSLFSYHSDFILEVICKKKKINGFKAKNGETSKHLPRFVTYIQRRLSEMALGYLHAGGMALSHLI